MKKRHFFSTLLLFLPLFVYAETAQAIETLLATNAVNYRQAAWLALEAADVSGPAGITGEMEAFIYAVELGWLPGNIESGADARLDNFSLLVMRAFRLRGGLLYTQFRSPRHAFRELVSNDILLGRREPGMRVSGYELLFTVNRVLSLMEDDLLLQEPLTRAELMKQDIIAALLANGITDARVRLLGEGVSISVSDVQFTADSTELSTRERENLRGLARIFSIIDVQNIRVAGHTAMAGTAATRQQVSLQRAETVRDFLVSLGALDAERISVHGYGGNRPVADNVTQAGMARNRRVEIIMMPE